MFNPISILFRTLEYGAVSQAFQGRDECLIYEILMSDEEVLCIFYCSELQWEQQSIKILGKNHSLLEHVAIL
jgi:hypothetical protein